MCGTHPPSKSISASSLAGSLSNGARVGVALCPPQQLPAADGGLLHREAEAEADHRIGAAPAMSCTPCTYCLGVICACDTSALVLCTCILLLVTHANCCPMKLHGQGILWQRPYHTSPLGLLLTVSLSGMADHSPFPRIARLEQFSTYVSCSLMRKRHSCCRWALSQYPRVLLCISPCHN